MLRLFLNNCGRCDNSRHLLQQIPKFHINTSLTKTPNDAAKWKKFHSSIRNAELRGGGKSSSQSSNNATKTRALLLGGGGVSIGLTARIFLQQTRHEVQCGGNIMGGVIQKTLQQEDRNFDWKGFWSYLQPHLLEFLGDIAAALVVVYINIRIPYLLGDLINILKRYIKEPLNNYTLKDVSQPASRLFSLYIIQSGFTFLYIYLLSRIGEQMAAKLRQDLFRQIIIQDMEFFDKNRTGKLIHRLTADIQDFKASFNQCISQGLRNVAQLIGGGVSLFLISPHMAAIVLASVPCVVMFMMYLGKKLRYLSQNSQVQSECATSVCEEALSNVRTVHSSAYEYSEIELLKHETNETARLAHELGCGIAVIQALTNFFLNGLVLSTLFMGGYLMSGENLSTDAVMTILVAFQDVQRTLAQGSELLGTMIRGMTAGTRVFEYLQLQPKVDLVRGYTIPTKLLKGEIRFENVSFAYPTRPDHIVLKNFNLTLRPGQTVALVGPSGSGKSTIASLVGRFYEPSSGAIKIDGYKLEDISTHWLRGNVLGFIEQQPVLFATTILENIRCGRPIANYDIFAGANYNIFAAANLSRSHDFVMALPEGYITNVGERGTQLSVGQRQRIAIARALLKNPKVLILDNATSALDATSEAEVQKALDTVILNRTTLVIPHRLSTIRNADLIVVLDKGRVVESGKHDKLMAKRGLYYYLVQQEEKHENRYDSTSENASSVSQQEEKLGNNNDNLPDNPPSNAKSQYDSTSENASSFSQGLSILSRRGQHLLKDSRRFFDNLSTSPSTSSTFLSYVGGVFIRAYRYLLNLFLSWISNRQQNFRNLLSFMIHKIKRNEFKNNV